MSHIDLNQLKVLSVLLEVRNTSLAAKRLHITQPAVSRTLAKLRESLGDELFVRTSKGLNPTARAEEMAKTLPLALASVYESVSERAAFSPELFTGKVSIAINEMIAQWLGPSLIEHILSQAPGMELKIVNWESSTQEMMLNGLVDIGITHLPSSSTKQLIKKNIGNDETVMLCRKDHPLKTRVIEPKHFEQYPLAIHIVPNYNDEKLLGIAILKNINIIPDLKITSTQLSVLLQIIDGSDMIMPCRKLMAQSLKDKFDYFEISKTITKEIRSHGIVYSNKVQKEPLTQWLEAQIETCIAQRVEALRN